MVFSRVSTEQNVDVSILADYIVFRNGRKAKNRFLKAAMTERLATWHQDDIKRCGFPNNRLINLYDKWGNGGFGMILTGNLLIDPYNLESAGNMIVCRENICDELRGLLSDMARVMKKDGALALAQLSHAGRQTPITINPTPFSASDIQLNIKRRYTGFGVPIPLSSTQIKVEVIERFVLAAKEIKNAGFDGIELHAAHGYLLSQFISPTTNHRDDKYGGSVENRFRIVLEIFHAIREEIPATTGFIVGIKLNSVEFQKDGLNTNDAKKICQMCEENGFDFVELTGGNIEKIAFSHLNDSTKAREAYFLDFTDQIRPVFHNTVLYVTGGFRTAKAMIEAVQSNSTDGIGIGRPCTAEPDLPKKILDGEVFSAADSQLDQNDFLITNLASGAQMFQLGDEPASDVAFDLCAGIADFSIPLEADNFIKEANLYMETIKEIAESGRAIHGVLEYNGVYNM